MAESALFDPGPKYEAHAVPAQDLRAWYVTGGTAPYRVELDRRGGWSCTCPHWTNRAKFSRARHCKHTLFVQKLIEPSPANPVPGDAA